MTGQELAKIRHDLRTPINHILGYCELLMEEEALPPQFHSDLTKVHNGGRQLLGLINEYFGEDAPDSKRHDLRELYHDLRTPVNHIVGYSELLQELAVELGRTGLLPDLGKIHSAARTWLERIEGYLLRPDSTPGEQPPPFGGAALAAEPPAGTATELYTLSDRAELHTPGAPERGTLLVVDDDVANRELLARRLRRQGYEVQEAGDGQEALDRLGKRAFDLVLLDMVMPGVDGLEVLRQARQQHSAAQLPIIMTTGRDSSADVVQALRLGANDYITKPIDFSVALARTRTHLRLKYAQQELQERMEEVRRLAKDLEVRNQFIKQVFGRYVTSDVVESLLETPAGLELGGQKRRVTMLMSDLRGFSTVVEGLPPEKVVELLNTYLGAMADIITRYQGTIDEFVGDAILAIFGAPVARDDDAERALACALAMQLAMEDINAQLARIGVPRLEMGIGINTGEVVVGNIGSAKRAKYGVVGSHVNLAARIESATVGGQVLASKSTVESMRSWLEISREMTVSAKGLKEPLVVYEVRGLGGGHGLRLPALEDDLVSLPQPLPVTCSLIGEHKQFVGEPFSCLLLGLSLRGGWLRCDAPLTWGQQFKGILGPPGASDGPALYGKVTDGPNTGGAWLVRFTAVPPDAAARLRQTLGAEGSHLDT